MKIQISKITIYKILIFLSISILFIVFSVQSTYAQELLPEPITDLMNLLGEEGEGATDFATSRVRLLLLIGLGGLILAAVVYAGMAAFKYIRSQGDPSQIEEAGKAVRSIFLGLAVLLISIIGIVLIFVFFGVEVFDTSAYQSCLSAPSSQGCIACQDGDGGLDSNWDNIRFDSDDEFDPGLMADPSNELKRTCTQCEWEYFRNSRGADLTISRICQD